MLPLPCPGRSGLGIAIDAIERLQDAFDLGRGAVLDLLGPADDRKPARRND